MKSYTILIFLILLVPLINSLDCPRGEINDPYPGRCSLYIDKNNDNLCDYSESEKIESINPENINLQNSDSRTMSKYYLLYIIIVTTIIYLTSYMLSKKNKIKLITHRKIWNFALLISFLGVGISGLILALEIEYSLSINLPINNLFWHVETGIVMTLIALFHTIWHLPYFKSYFSKN